MHMYTQRHSETSRIPLHTYLQRHRTTSYCLGQTSHSWHPQPKLKKVGGCASGRTSWREVEAASCIVVFGKGGREGGRRGFWVKFGETTSCGAGHSVLPQHIQAHPTSKAVFLKHLHHRITSEAYVLAIFKHSRYDWIRASEWPLS